MEKNTDDIRILLSDRKTIIKFSDFIRKRMKAIGVEVTDGKFVALKDKRSSCKLFPVAITWNEAEERVNHSKGEHIPSYEDLKALYDECVLINTVLEKIGGEPINNECFYWLSDEKDAWFAFGFNMAKAEHKECRNRSAADSYTRCRFFIEPNMI